MKKILYLNAIGEISGAERSLLAILDALDRRYWQPAVAAPEGPLLGEALAHGAQAFPLALQPLRRPRSPADAWQMLGGLRTGWRAVERVVAAWAPDLLHANTTAAMVYACHIHRCPVIWQVRDLTPLDRWGALLYRRVTRVAAVSTAVREFVLPLAGDGGTKITLLPPAVDTARFRPSTDRAALRERLALPNTVPLIGLVAQFVPWKRHHLFLDALALLADRPWHAVLAGADLHHDQAYLAGLRARVLAPPLRDRVSWLPWQTDPAALFAALDVCVLTSDHEPFGRALIEAMACGVPVVAVDAAGPSEIVLSGETGLLTADTPCAIADALATFLGDPARRTACGQAARLRATAAYSLAGQTRALMRLYTDCLPAAE